ncbi:MAG: NAD(P)/FAD-dependent oxidoreductase [bacterium]|nr:NAD(P)/FAD-dependent oxidoreductase [bacterium]
MSDADAIVIGAGHNGLTCAAYLARAGRKVLVLEKRYVIGGATVTEEIHEGFKYSVCSYVVSLLRPEVTRELELAKHGLQIHPVNSIFMSNEDGPPLISWPDEAKTRNELRKFSRRDADMAAKFEEVMFKLANAVKPILGYTPPDLAAPSLRDLKTLKSFGAHLKGLGKDTFHTLYKVMTMSAEDFLAEYFETDIIRANHALSAVIGTFLGPKSPGTAYVLLHHYMGDLDGAYSAWGAQLGGTGGVAAAIASSAREHGAEIRTDAPVEQVIVKNGKAVGVALENGDEIYADTIVSGADPRVTFRKFIEEKELPADLIDRIDKFKFRGSSGKVNLALDGLPRFRDMPDDSLLKGSMPIAPSMDFLEQAYDDAKYGDFSKRPVMEIEMPSMIDPTMAPPGKHMMSVFVQYCSYKMPQHGNADEQRDAFGNAVLDTIEEFCPNIKDIILHQQVLTPWDMESQFSLTEGNIFHGELTLDQLFFQRPAAGYADYRTPIRNYWQCGSGTHPGGGIMAMPGRLAAKEILGGKIEPARTT